MAKKLHFTNTITRIAACILLVSLAACGKKLHGNMSVAFSEGCVPPDQFPSCVVDVTNTNTNDFDWHNVQYELSCQEAFHSPSRNMHVGMASTWDNATYGNVFIENKTISAVPSGKTYQMRFGPFRSCRPIRLKIISTEGETVSEQRKVKDPSKSPIGPVTVYDSETGKYSERPPNEAEIEANSYTYQWVRVR